MQNLLVSNTSTFDNDFSSPTIIQIASCLAVAASAEAFYGYQLPASGLATWPSTGNGYGASSTVYGAHGYRIGKRSADASYGYGIGYGIALPTTLENRNNVHGH